MDGVFCFAYVVFLTECTGNDVDYIGCRDRGVAYGRKSNVCVCVMDEFSMFVV